jgi:hypothetical protein
MEFITKTFQKWSPVDPASLASCVMFFFGHSFQTRMSAMVLNPVKFEIGIFPTSNDLRAIVSENAHVGNLAQVLATKPIKQQLLEC